MSLVPRSATRTWLRNERGATAVEFALIVVPFFMFVLGIIGVGLYFFTEHSLEHGVELAARKIRTGEAQKSDLTVAQFKQLLCDQAGSYIDCNKMHVIVQSGSNWTDISPEPCVDKDNNMTASTGNSDDPLSDYSGDSSSVALVTVCYEWDLAKMLGFLKLGKNADGSGAAILQAATAFRIEPYSTS